MTATDPTPSSTVLANVQEYYGKILSSTKDLKTSACCTSAAPHPLIRAALKKVPAEVTDRYYGCGNPIPLGIEGLTVLDLGCGTGRDVYIAAGLVGEKGEVIGVDMTDEQLKVARDALPAFAKQFTYTPRVKFAKAYIENLDAIVPANSIDLCISNCVINLSPDKEAVLRGVYNALKEGGEMYFSDVYCDRRMPEALVGDKILYGECLSGALYINDFVRLCHKVGFTDPRALSSAPIELRDPAIAELCGNIKFYSITYRLFKLPSLETLCEDYGQVATYLGTIPGHTHAYELDDHHTFVTGKPVLVCGNSADMVGRTWLGKHFKVDGDRSVHFGAFDCAPVPGGSSSSPAAGGCC
ncbi:S-adenosyl-L-methionine-dependent methyltransferase [Fimicolochytrium jonesii]|uniref:S-adenosyl-L-methionine-dependent methyltransferase n=1 Tax=Fimicolochytrium jonesii TaxID=1396493 RepID=UPI0022FDCDE5|nr:S-adenosyl-L-methionine-dependent methyltransferase [Fimicolochytrium jonesii]KAI8820804.1 S-adenosyl-L-methionine-dependent methyltransferase [Fimicolochytrium jonesii]